MKASAWARNAGYGLAPSPSHSRRGTPAVASRTKAVTSAGVRRDGVIMSPAPSRASVRSAAPSRASAAGV